MTDMGASMRNAALLLHAMPAPDRDWLLAQLRPDERKDMETLLGELQALGLQADRELLSVLSSIPAVPCAREPEAAPPSHPVRHALRNAGPIMTARIAALLAAEPPALIAALLGMDDWPWKTDVMARLDAARRREVEQALHDGRRPAPRLQEQLCTLLHARLQASSDGPGPFADAVLPQRSGWRATLRQGWQSMTGRRFAMADGGTHRGSQ